MTVKTPPKAVAKAAPEKAPALTSHEVQALERPTAAYVVGTCPVLHNGKTYLPGFDIELTDAEADRLGALVRQVPTDPEPPLE